MRILEQSEDVLTLQSSAINFWFGRTCALFSSSFSLFMLVMAAPSGWWVSPLSFLLLIVLFSTLADIWAGNVVKVCSFDKSLRKVTVKCYGLQAKTKDFPLQCVQAVEVRKHMGFAYGVGIESAELWLVTGNFGVIPLSEANSNVASSEAIANQVREFLNLRSCSM